MELLVYFKNWFLQSATQYNKWFSFSIGSTYRRTGRFGPPTASTQFTNNITNGYPTSNAWQESLEGSYFNNFDNTTHVSEILRFMAE